MWMVPPQVVYKIEASAHGEPVDARIQLVLYDLLVECIRVPLWVGEVVQESSFDGELPSVIEGWFVF